MQKKSTKLHSNSCTLSLSSKWVPFFYIKYFNKCIKKFSWTVIQAQTWSKTSRQLTSYLLLNHDERESWVFSSGDHNVNKRKCCCEKCSNAQITSNPTFREQYEFHPLSSFSSSPYPIIIFFLFSPDFIWVLLGSPIGFSFINFFKQKKQHFFSICTPWLTFGLP